MDPERVKLETLCIDGKTGKVIWRRDAPTEEIEKVHPANSPASATPATDGERVYVYFGSFGLLCYDLSGKLVWSRPLGLARNRWGMGTSPILTNGSVILACEQGQPEEKDPSLSFLLAVDARSGETFWKVDRPAVRSGWSTPIVWRRQDATDLIMYSTSGITAYDPDNGEQRWNVMGLPQDTVGTPAVGKQLLFVSGTVTGGDADRPMFPEFDQLLKQQDRNGDGEVSRQEMPDSAADPRYRAGGPVLSLRAAFGLTDKDKNGRVTRTEWEQYQKMMKTIFGGSDALVALRPGDTGDVTATKISWTAKRGIPDTPSPLFLNGRLYLTKSGGVVSCFDAESGDLLYRKRAGARGNISASPVAGRQNIYVCSEQGDIAVLRDGLKFQELSCIRLGERIMATPALAAGCIYVRTDDHLYAFSRN